MGKEETQDKIPIRLRWLIRRDMPEVLDIENSSFENPWLEEDFLSHLRQRNCIGMVAEGSCDTRYSERILGFMFYELHKSTLNVLNFAVHPEYRRQKIGSQMTDKLKDKLPQQDRYRITVETRESVQPATDFFRSQEFKEISRIPAFYRGNSNETVGLEYRVQQPQLTYTTREIGIKDLPKIVKIGNTPLESPLTEKGLLEKLKQPEYQGELIEIDGQIQGFVVYQLYDFSLQIENIAVFSESRRNGIGSQTVNNLKKYLDTKKRTLMNAEIPISNQPARDFFTSQGFKEVGMIPPVYERNLKGNEKIIMSYSFI